MALTTLFGTVQLALQEALSRAIDSRAAPPAVPNFAIVSVRRDRFLADNPGELREEKERFRRDLDEAVRSFITANGWRVGGTGSLVINLLLRAIPKDCIVQVRTTPSLYELHIVDDAAPRAVGVRSLRATVGREHAAHSRGFVGVLDHERMVSREHLLLTYEDLALSARLLGRNPTTLNGDPLGAEEAQLRNGDRIECGRVSITVGGLG